MTGTDLVWAVGRATIGTAVKLATPLRVYGAERMPADDGLVVAANHFSWLDPPALGTASPRTLYFMAKMEAHRAGARPVDAVVRGVPGPPRRVRPRRRADDAPDRARRERARHVRRGTRQRGGVPGPVQPGAAMVAINESVPLIPAAIHGSHTWRIGNFAPVSVAWGEPMTFEGLRAGQGLKEASLEVERKLHELWQWLVELHALGRPRDATPPR